MDDLLLGCLIMLFAGSLPCIVVGYLIAVKQKRNLIAGWDESKISQPEAFAKWLGYSVLLLGVLIGLIAVAWFVGAINEMGLTSLLLVASLIPIPCFIVAKVKYGASGS
ncbi:hypothetical protein HHX48_10035 [Salinimonas sp. HHU 13199]|uniref:DUF3784 domain-containing protein n=1 Tax=Salinimonas profundi TaxID=2729140 RepID=A0ABR8LNS4_9ALTE|nr:hypothetical protein [Salinimonas profundi]MBD3586077.1 hypothetical protein [Salinimonas profundi]